MWDGVTQSATFHPEIATRRESMFEHAHAQRWSEFLAALESDRQSVNGVRLDHPGHDAPLHVAVAENAPIEVVQVLFDLGAWRTVRNAARERPLDIALRTNRPLLLKLLEPVFRREADRATLQQIEIHFHEVIHGRADELIEQHQLRLPQMEPLLEMDAGSVWFPVPGMYGGFNYRLEGAGSDIRLVTESWCRVVEGSGERHEITPTGSTLVESGFV